MRHMPIHWSEGMFLRPHHFQATERHWHEQLAVSADVSDRCSYGFSRLEIDRSALANRQLVIRACRARFRDGTLVSFGEGDEPDRLDLSHAEGQLRGITASLGELQDTRKRSGPISPFPATHRLSRMSPPPVTTVAAVHHSLGEMSPMTHQAQTSKKSNFAD